MGSRSWAEEWHCNGAVLCRMMNSCCSLLQGKDDNLGTVFVRLDYNHRAPSRAELTISIRSRPKAACKQYVHAGSESVCGHAPRMGPACTACTSHRPERGWLSDVSRMHQPTANGLALVCREHLPADLLADTFIVSVCHGKYSADFVKAATSATVDASAELSVTTTRSRHSQSW